MPFIASVDPEPHLARRGAILEAHPEIRALMGRDGTTFLWILLLVGIQVGMAAVVSRSPLWVLPLAAIGIGAFANHAAYVLIHDAIHGLVFRNSVPNRLAAILANLSTGVPSAIAFRTYHLQHHQHQGVNELDADLPRRWEIWLFDRGLPGKLAWISLYSLIIMFRPLDLSGKTPDLKWSAANYVAVLAFDLVIFMLLGPAALLYLLLSTFLGLGPHPVGARWIQEHFVMAAPQETYSYYGPLNRVAFNVGYHNEHHDFPGIAWSRLPRVRELAPEYYDSLVYHRSWTGLLWRFLTDPRVTLESRVERETRFGMRTAGTP
jgi:sphingolipid 4-desaturase/C4-monooxygenase